MAQKQALEDDATATQRKMDSANALLSALAGEEGRWTQQSKEFDDTIQKLTGMSASLFRILDLYWSCATGQLHQPPDQLHYCQRQLSLKLTVSSLNVQPAAHVCLLMRATLFAV